MGRTPRNPKPPEKIFYQIGEVADIMGVKTHILRHWENEFPALAPRKSTTGIRLFTKKDIAVAKKIKTLLYEKGFTIPGARKALKGSQDEFKSRLINVKKEIRDILRDLRKGAAVVK